MLALTRLWQIVAGAASGQAGADLAWAVPGFLYVLLQGIQHVVVRGPAGGAADVSANLTWPFTALVAGLDRDAHRMSLTHLGTYDYNLIEFLALMAFVVAGFLVLRSTTAPVHERVAFVGFFVVEVVSASSQFWYSVFGEGRTYIDAYVMAVVLLLATPAGSVTAGVPARTRPWPSGSSPRPRDHQQAPGLASRGGGGRVARGRPPPHPVRMSQPSSRLRAGTARPEAVPARIVGHPRLYSPRMTHDHRNARNQRAQRDKGPPRRRGDFPLDPRSSPWVVKGSVR